MGERRIHEPGVALMVNDGSILAVATPICALAECNCSSAAHVRALLDQLRRQADRQNGRQMQVRKPEVSRGPSLG